MPPQQPPIPPQKNICDNVNRIVYPLQVYVCVLMTQHLSLNFQLIKTLHTTHHHKNTQPHAHNQSNIVHSSQMNEWTAANFRATLLILLFIYPVFYIDINYSCHVSFSFMVWKLVELYLCILYLDFRSFLKVRKVCYKNIIK